MQLSQSRSLDSPTIPDRLYFKIGDVARICEVQTYVLRFWETQFPQLKPNKSGNGQRLYRRRDVELALEIKRLVHGEGYTIPGARQALEGVHRRQTPRRAAQRELQPEALPEFELQQQQGLPLMVSDANRQLDTIAATIGRARAELREIAGLLAVKEPSLPRRRSRLATVPLASETLFPQ